MNRGWQGRGKGSRSAPADRPEDRLQEQIISFHAAAVDQRHAVCFAVPNGERRDKATAARLSGLSSELRDLLPDDQCLRPAGLGVLPGVADLILLLAGGRVVLVEVKIPRAPKPPVLPGLFPPGAAPPTMRAAGTLSRAQKRFRAGVQVLGHDYRVVRTVEEYADLLEALGVPLRTRPWGPGVLSPRPPAGLGNGR